MNSEVTTQYAEVRTCQNGQCRPIFQAPPNGPIVPVVTLPVVQATIYQPVVQIRVRGRFRGLFGCLFGGCR